VTVIEALPVLLPAVALIVADPGFTPVTNPVADTVAIVEFDDDHATVALVVDGFSVAVSCCVAPCATTALDGDTVTDLTLSGGPPLAKLGARESAAPGPLDDSEQAMNTTATTTADVARIAALRIRMRCLTSGLLHLVIPSGAHAKRARSRGIAVVPVERPGPLFREDGDSSTAALTRLRSE
jgi:hypothetical protein